jgi:hypothetical protein
MVLSPEEQYHQDIYNEENDNTNIYIPKTPTVSNAPTVTPIPPSMPAPQEKKLIVAQVLMKQMSKLNEKIINYFKDNLSELNANSYVFEWIAVHDEEIDYYEEQGIEKFPILIIDDVNITGVSNILKYLDSIIGSDIIAQSPPQRPATQPLAKPTAQTKKETDEEMHEFLLQELKSNDADKEEDEQDSFSNNISQRFSEMRNARKAGGMEKSNNEDADIFKKTMPTLAKPSKSGSPSTPTDKISLNTVDLIKKTSKSGGEDDMMRKFWENQEETPMD